VFPGLYRGTAELTRDGGTAARAGVEMKQSRHASSFVAV
jgi:hypothetical protein